MSDVVIADFEFASAGCRAIHLSCSAGTIFIIYSQQNSYCNANGAGCKRRPRGIFWITYELQNNRLMG